MLKRKYSLYRLQQGTLVVILLLICVSCKKLIEVSPPDTQLAGNSVYAEDATAAAVLTGAYAQLSAGSFATGRGSLSLRTGLSSDELTLYDNSGDQTLTEYYLNALTSRSVEPFWTELYKYVNVANTAIEGINASNTLTPEVKQQLLGEAKFLRAFLHFYLTNLYGDVPLVLASSYKENNVIARSPAADVYQQIITDLRDAENSLSAVYLEANVRTPSFERVRPTSWAAAALLARVYLYLGDWKRAEEEATKVLQQTDLFETVPLNDVFLKESREAIWQLGEVSPDLNTFDGNIFVLTDVPNYSTPVYLSSLLLNTFEPGDLRRDNWVSAFNADDGTTYYFPFKYKIGFGTPVIEYLTVLRLGEQYLIRAEARARQSNLQGAQDDLNVLRTRAGLPPDASADQAALLLALRHERQVELFTEWGHRWLDIKRTDAVNDIMTAAAIQKGTSWSTNWRLFPVPFNDILRDKNLTQNTGY